MAHVHRSGEKSSGCFSPIGKLSSALSGWRSRSTSSIMRQPDSNRRKTCARQRISCSIDGCCLVRARIESSFSSSFNWILLIVDAVQSTAPRLRAADWSFSTVAHRISDERSKERVKTRFRMMDENVARSVALDCSSRAGGIVCTTRVCPSPRRSASIGPTTVVLPPPISICLTKGWPLRTADTNSRTSCTCAPRRTMLCVNSKSRKRGS
mmetsp:Transcript_3712/g.6080  ORF Transcript_3712/g.6080 Transcript_3712/m.6080 type:complete len:210 (-) Transcript_3712:22-651(-)